MSEQQNVAELQAAVTRLQQLNSLVLATVAQDGTPQASYAPFAEYDGCLYILLSGLAPHTQNLQQQEQASVMLIEDEASARNIFARARLNYTVSVTVIEKNTTDGIAALQAMKTKLGNTVDVLSELPDFMLFRLQLEKARLVTGFGRAYVFMPGKVDGAIQLTEKNAKTV
nr:pyridoxamine 5'-phosphate oxidase family protein [Snodgrassella alvi]